MISRDTIEEIKERAKLVEIVSETVALKRQGSGFIGLCPFHHEKTPSFHVREHDNYYHCFGCGVTGNPISFIMETRGLTFPEAVEDLARRYGVEVKHEGGVAPEDKGFIKEALYKINRAAFEFFRESLKKAPPKVIDYLKSRSLSSEAIEKFGIGFAPDSWSGLFDTLKTKKFEEDAILKSGLVRRSSKGDLYDVFRGRLIFPVWFDVKRIAGFGGRVIPSLFDPGQLDSMPKYLNSSETPVYLKKKILFGFPQAIDEIRKTREVYLVEGYMDVVGLWQHGVKNVLATCGTAVSTDHIERLGQIAKKVIVLFDGDSAGREAAAKTFVLFMNSGLDVHALFLPEDEDPDSIARKHGKKTREVLASQKKVELLDCYIDSLVHKLGSQDVKELGAALKGQLSEDVIKVLSGVENTIEKNELIKRAAFRLIVDPDTLFDVEKRFEGKSVKAAPHEKAVEGARTLLPSKRKPITELPVLDRELLSAVMAQKEELPQVVLRDSELCLGLSPSALLFIEGLSEIMSSGELSESAKKDGILGLLRDFGESWIAHWRDAHKMASDPDVNLGQLFKECQEALRKIKLNQAVTKIDEEIRKSADESTKLTLLQEKLSLSRRLNQL